MTMTIIIIIIIISSSSSGVMIVNMRINSITNMIINISIDITNIITMARSRRCGCTSRAWRRCSSCATATGSDSGGNCYCYDNVECY